MVVSSTLRGHKHAILCLTTARDDLCSGSTDQTIKVWNKGEEKHHKYSHETIVVTMCHWTIVVYYYDLTTVVFYWMAL
jgi:hypothetical protein